MKSRCIRPTLVLARLVFLLYCGLCQGDVPDVDVNGAGAAGQSQPVEGIDSENQDAVAASVDTALDVQGNGDDAVSPIPAPPLATLESSADTSPDQATPEGQETKVQLNEEVTQRSERDGVQSGDTETPTGGSTNGTSDQAELPTLDVPDTTAQESESNQEKETESQNDDLSKKEGTGESGVLEETVHPEQLTKPAPDTAQPTAHTPDPMPTDVASHTSTDGSSGAQTETSPPVSDDTQDNLEEFEEWKKKRMPDIGGDVVTESSNSQDIIKPGKKLTNFASAECGAKVMASNPEAKNAPYLLSENKDEYMINPCSAKKWFVVQLCEAVEQIHAIEIANLELFSSVPETFKVFISDRFPVKEWTFPLGTFHAKEHRSVQSFNVTAKSQMFAKYVRFEMSTHYGKEHYCPLSLLRIYATSVEDMGDDGDSDGGGEQEGAGVDNKVGEATPVQDSDAPSNLFSTTADTVLSLVKSVLSPTDAGHQGDTAKPVNQTVFNETSGVNKSYYAPNTNFSKEGLPLPCTQDGDGEGQDPDNVTVSKELSDSQTQVNVSEETSSSVPTSEPAPVVTKLADHEQQPVDISLPSIVTLVERPSTSVREVPWSAYSCLVCEPVTDKCMANTSDICSYVRLVMASVPRRPYEMRTRESSVVTDAVGNGVQLETVSSDSESSHSQTMTELTSESTGSQDSVLSWKQLSHAHSTSTETGEVADTQETASSVAAAPSVVEPDSASSFSSVSEGLSVGTDRDVVQSPHCDSASSESSASSSVTTKAEDSEDVLSSQTEPVVVQSSSGETKESEVVSTPQLQLETKVATDEIGIASDISSTTNEEVSATTSTKEVTTPVVDESQVIHAHDTKEAVDLQPVAPSGTLIKKLMPKRDVVIMKLSNNIRALEANLSLTNLYLQELSQKYRKQREEMQRALNWTMEKLMNTTREAEQKEVERNKDMQQLQATISEMSASLRAVTERMNHFQQDVISRHVILVFIEMLFMAFMLVLFCRGPRRRATSESSVERVRHPSAQRSLVRKHSADGTIGHEPPDRPVHKRAVSFGDLTQRNDDADGDIAVIEPQDIFASDTMPHASAPKRKKKRKSQQGKLFHSKSGSDVCPVTKQHSSADLTMSPAGLLFGVSQKPVVKGSLVPSRSNSNPVVKGHDSKQGNHAYGNFNEKKRIGKTGSESNVKPVKRVSNGIVIRKDEHGTGNGELRYVAPSCAVESIGQVDNSAWSRFFGGNNKLLKN